MSNRSNRSCAMNLSNFGRRSWLKKCTGLLASGTLLSCSPKGTFTDKSIKPGQTTCIEPEYQAFFGDIHTHNNIGLAQGSLERSYEIADSHLDFFATTPHSYFHDKPPMSPRGEMLWENGIARTKERWPDIQQLNREYYKPGKFVTFNGYEWHSVHYGDYVALFPAEESPLTHFDDLEPLQQFAMKHGALLIPHHLAYSPDNRGANTAHWNTKLTPVVEIYSEHGNAEKDRGPHDYIRHSHGGRWTPNTYQAILAAGHRTGAIASTDDHFGFPGAYGEGLAAVLTKELTREAVFDALRNRRTYAVTGDRINLDFRLNGAHMGQELDFIPQREIYVHAQGWDEIESVELIKNGKVIYRDFPLDRDQTEDPWGKPLLLRVEYGWGPWSRLENIRIADWEMDVCLQGGRIEALQPCWQSGPLAEERRHVLTQYNAESFSLVSYTSRHQAFEERATNAFILKAMVKAQDKLVIHCRKPSEITIEKSMAELLQSSQVVLCGPYPEESFLIHRMVSRQKAQSIFRLVDQETGKQDDWYYVRVIQSNGHMAWSSPIWVNARA